MAPSDRNRIMKNLTSLLAKNLCLLNEIIMGTSTSLGRTFGWPIANLILAIDKPRDGTEDVLHMLVNHGKWATQ